MAIVLKKKVQLVPVPAQVAEVDEGLSDFADLIDLVAKLEDEAKVIKARIKADTEKLKPFHKALAMLLAKIEELGEATMRY